ncbi:unnamed protein product, partial [Prorocentrum cordatum]
MRSPRAGGLLRGAEGPRPHGAGREDRGRQPPADMTTEYLNEILASSSPPDLEYLTQYLNEMLASGQRRPARAPAGHLHR